MPIGDRILKPLLALPGAQLSGRGVLLENDGFKVEATLAFEQLVPAVMVKIDFFVWHPTLFQGVLKDFTMGFGASKDEAIQAAIKDWETGTLVVLQQALQPDLKNPPLKATDLTTKDATGQYKVWTIFQGPLQGINLDTERAPAISLNENEISKILSNILTEKLPQAPLWIRSVVTRFQDDYRGECLLNNEIWLDGQKALYIWGYEWGPCPEVVTRNQFLFCVLTDKAPNPSITGEANHAQIKRKPARKWWQFWK